MYTHTINERTDDTATHGIPLIAGTNVYHCIPTTYNIESEYTLLIYFFVMHLPNPYNLVW